MSSTSCDNQRQSFAKLSYSAIDNVLTNLLPAGLHDFFQVLNVSNATTTVNKLLEVSPDRTIVYWAIRLGWAIRRRFPSFFSTRNGRINALSSLVNGRVFIFTAMTSHRILITTEYLNAHFISVFLSVYTLQVLKASFYANFRKRSNSPVYSAPPCSSEDMIADRQTHTHTHAHTRTDTLITILWSK